ncbi:hypothetical protein I312_105471 [Cryptococcus bacillisporus CA1280]|uniref:uncharacterized protein n=1 Tax=Cryptococcus bacillisporus CA1280 TaxID=1296109 RepID=UPI003367D8E4
MEGGVQGRFQVAECWGWRMYLVNKEIVCGSLLPKPAFAHSLKGAPSWSHIDSSSSFGCNKPATAHSYQVVSISTTEK